MTSSDQARQASDVKEKKVPKKKSEKPPKARASMNSKKANKGRETYLENHHLRRMLINSRCERQNEWLIFRSQHKITQSEWALLSRVAVGWFRQNWTCQSTSHCCWVVVLGLLLTQFVALCAQWCFHHKKDMALHQNFFLTHGSRTC